MSYRFFPVLFCVTVFISCTRNKDAGEKASYEMCRFNIDNAQKERNGQKSLVFSLEALNLAKSLDDKSLIAESYAEISFDYSSLGNYTEALKYALLAAGYFEDLRANNWTGSIYNQIGNIYANQGNHQLANKYYLKAYEIHKSMNAYVQQADDLNNLGESFRGMHQYDSAFKYFSKAEDIITIRLTEPLRLAYVQCGIGLVYFHKGQFPKGDSIINTAFKSLHQLNDFYAICFTLNEIAKISFEKGNLNNALQKGQKAFQIAEKNHFTREIRDISLLLSNIYKQKHQFEQAQIFLEQYMTLKDTLVNERIISQMAEMRTEFEVGRKESEVAYLKTIGKFRLIFIHLLIVMVFLSGSFIWFLLKTSRKRKEMNIMLRQLNDELNQRNEEITAQRDEIEAQHDKIQAQNTLLEQKNNNLFASITYARRIQQSILPQFDKITALFPESFIIYRPRDIVSGDFYWIYENKNKIYFSLVDCTGHGVPGALMSILTFNFLKKVVQEDMVTNPPEILNNLNQLVNLTLRKENREQNINDGMDMAMCCLDQKTLMLEYAGSHIPLYVVRNHALKKYQPDRHYIGNPFSLSFSSFTNHFIQLKPKDHLYLFTDGFADQFGGPKGKKITTSRLEKLLVDIHGNLAKKQGEMVSEMLYSWMCSFGKSYEQTDDISGLGIVF